MQPENKIVKINEQLLKRRNNTTRLRYLPFKITKNWFNY